MANNSDVKFTITKAGNVKIEIVRRERVGRWGSRGRIVERLARTVPRQRFIRALTQADMVVTGVDVRKPA